MFDTVRNFAIDWQDWMSSQSMSLDELLKWQDAIRGLVDAVDDNGELLEELQENGIL